MESDTSSQEDDLNENFRLSLSTDSEDMNAYEMPQDFDNPAKNGEPREATFMEEITITEKASEIPNNAAKGSRGVLSEECHLNLTDLDVILEKNYIKQQNDILKAPGVEIIEDHEKLNSRESCSEDQTADKAAISQEAGLGVLDVAEKAFDFNMGKTIVKRHSHAGFSEHLLDSWEKGVHSSSPIVSDAKNSHEEVFSVVSLLQNEHAADKVKRRCNHDYISGKGQCEEQFAFTMKDIGKKVSEKESIASKEHSSCSTDSNEAETREIHCREEIGFASESSSKSCASKRKNKTNTTIKPCYVLLKNSHEIKEKHENCLMPPDAKKLPPETQNKKVTLKKLQVVLSDLLVKSYTKKLRKSHKIENAEALLENEKVNKMESGLELNSSGIGLSSGGSETRETNTAHDIIKTGSRPNSPDLSELCEQGVFARCSFMEPNHSNSIINLCPVQKSEMGTGNTKRLSKSHKIENAEALLENEKVNKMEIGLELNSSGKGLSSGGSETRETNTAHDIIKTGSRPNSPDLSELCEQGVFARFSFMESNHRNSIINLCPVQKSKTGTGSTKRLRKSHKIENVEALLEKSGLELNSSGIGLSSGGSDSRETNTAHDIIKTGSRPNSPDLSELCEQGVFARFSFMESNHRNSTINLRPVQKSETGTESLPIDSVLIPETQKPKTKSFEPTEMFMEYGNKLVKQAEREDPCHKIEYQDRETITSRFSGETSIDNTGQFSRINLISYSHGETLQTNKINSACSSETSFSETKFSKTSIRSKGALPDKASHEGDTCQVSCEFDEPLSTERQIVSNPNTLAEEALENQLDVEEQEALNQSNPVSRNKNLDSCWFLLEIEEVIDVGVPTCVTEEEKFRELECGEVLLDHGIGFPQSESKSTCHLLPDDITIIKHSEIGKGTMPSEHKEGCDGEIRRKRPVMEKSEESVNPQPAKENISVGEEERLQPEQSQHVQIVFYELVGSVVKLLGTPSDNCEMFNLGKLIELEDSSDDEESQSRCASLSMNSKKEGKLHSANKPLNSDDSKTKKKRSQRPDKTPAPVYSPQLSQEQSRIKVVDALRETLQKRLDDSPGLIVQKNAVSKIAKQVEGEIFKLSCCVDHHYKKKYRSLLFNLKSTENQHLFRMVILGEITPKRLVQLSSLELAPKELVEWRAKQNKHVLEIIEKEEREAPKCCSAKFTHKGIVEIHREADEDLSSQEIFGLQSLKDGNSSSEISIAPVRDPRDEHWSHLRETDYFSSGQMTADSERGFKPPTCKRTLNQKTNDSKCLHPSSMYPEGEGRPLQEDSPISPGIPKKHRRVEEESKTSAIWKGLIQMFSVKQFPAEAYLVSGSSCHLCQGLPHLLQSRGCILPEDVWAYLDSIWPANSKEMGLIRFHPSLSKGYNPYNMLYSYLNNKQRYGIVDSNQMEIFMVPLAAFQPVPSKLRPLGGPGLDPSHPSLLLGLILPKRSCTSTLESRPNPIPKAKRVTFKDSTETKCFALPLHSEEDTKTWPPRQRSIDGLLCGNEGPLTGLPRQEPLTADALLFHMEELGRQMLHIDPSSLHHKEVEDEANQPPLGGTLQLPSGSPWTAGQLGNLTLEILGAQPHQDGDQEQFCIDSDPSHFQNAFGLPLPSESVYPQQHGTDGAGGGSMFEALFLPSMLCAEVVLPGEASQVLSLPQIPCTKCPAGEPSSLVEETLSLIQHVTQLQSHIQGQEPQPAAAFILPVMPQEITSALSQAAAGLEFPPVQPDDGTYAQLQLLLSTLRGQTQPPSAV